MSSPRGPRAERPSSAGDPDGAPRWLTPERLVTVALVATLALGKLLLSGAALRYTAFAAVSDDDYARVVIAQAFAHAPKLDPSGTSWLPLPFWLNGAAMMALGRGLASARALAVLFGVVSVALTFVGARAAGLTPARAALATALFAATPWSLWLGVSTVPEALTAGLVAAGAPLALADESTRARRLIGALCILLATLSRYEAWPVAVAAAGVLGFRAATGRARSAEVVPAAIAMLAGPAAWMAWNAHAHDGDPLHFVARVTRFRQASGQAAASLGDKLLVYPRALVTEAPEVALLACATFGALASPRLRERVAPLAAVMGAVALFLLYGVVRDGAPTHHPARALVVLFPLVAIAGTEVAASTLGRAGARAKAALLLAAVVALSVVWPRAWRTPPGTDLASDRSPQVAMGLELRARGGAGRYRVTPCAFEHFALIAALGAPERVEIAKPEKTATAPPPSPVDAPCPRLESL